MSDPYFDELFRNLSKNDVDIKTMLISKLLGLWYMRLYKLWRLCGEFT